MKLTSRIITGALLLAGPAAFAQVSVTANADILASISLSTATNLIFGNIIAGTGGTVVVPASGAPSVTGGVTLAAGTHTPASFTATGTSGATYTIAVTTPTPVHLTGPGTDLTVDTFTFLPTSPATFTGAADVIKVGGTLTVGASQTAGVYSGSFSVAVAYN